MIKEGLFLSVLMLLYTLISIGLNYVNLGFNFSDTSILKIAAYGVPAVLLMLVPIGGKETNIYWKLLGLSISTYMIGGVSNIVIIYFILFARLVLEGIAFYGFLSKFKAIKQKPANEE